MKGHAIEIRIYVYTYLLVPTLTTLHLDWQLFLNEVLNASDNYVYAILRAYFC